MDEYSCHNVGMKLLRSRNTVNRTTGRELALIHENDEYAQHSSSSENLDEFGDDGKEDSEDGEEEVLRPNLLLDEHNVMRIPWFETEEYTPITIINALTFPLFLI